MSDFPSQQQDKFVLRLPDGMRDRIKSVADKNGRSMNAEIIRVLDATFPILPKEIEEALGMLGNATIAMGEQHANYDQDQVRAIIRESCETILDWANPKDTD
ncbi:Arc family DNA-binding protein [Sulfitobacter mediterraneus]|uniref:Arc family DNA-binding protein n=1 Tax=Sulfitobacter mediterraneus TaxID=83219 RepID=UPI001933F5E1|nr:Arc family DNA-binding protein [Sulfitobacter mediterraneus]MBM1309067.1 Arc family DNA-binding protein [Sulfitobacter mediterraneus]MBM1312951.1 Arc family DNA-binding protein [Sulfitobacter mediterraneus]MBM1321334.1 Arc family DNA-binding protein [Sulfitobacter mediterraneus]MBM1325221.1 Arc family DNA-binding protein [Sulfitobacter mediterraneus]MBM1396568.1 Arc family DNA-binding protein [Sulfitobacter mediterraneus]